MDESPRTAFYSMTRLFRARHIWPEIARGTSLPYTGSVHFLAAQEALWPTGWELIGRIIVVIGVAGLFGLAARQVGIWLRTRYRRGPK